MSLRGNLFIKIFIGFWLVTTAILGSWMLVAEYFDSRPEGVRTGPRHTGPPQRFLVRTIYNLQNESEDELQALVEDTRKKHGIDIYLLDRQGEDLFQRAVPDDVRRLAEKLGSGRRRISRQDAGAPMMAHLIHRREYGVLRAVFKFPPRHDLLRTLGSNLKLRIALAVLTSGLLCYLLSRLMTNRLKALQQASRRLADGELDTRLQVRRQGGDETDELARDFNTMAQQLQERIQAQRRLLADVSHELRSPLARLRIALALAQEDTAKSDDHLRRIEHEALRLEELIGQLLSSQQQSVSLDTHIDLVELLKDLCVDAGFEGKPANKTVNFAPGKEQAVVASSGDLLHKVFDNILRNALIHTADGSNVDVTLVQENAQFRICITDQGPGVPEEQLQNIFSEFYRVDTARSRETGGYGLGLAIARRAVVQHGGQLDAVNTGSGLAVTVVLPAVDL